MNIDLLHYIEQARKSGMNDNKIREGLLQSGWTDNDISEAFIQSQPATDLRQSKSKTIMSKTLAVVFIVLIIALAGYFTGAYYMANYQNFPLWPFEAPPITTFTPGPLPTQQACTQEAKLCPDGSAVGRTGPNCEFAPCPGEVDTSTWQTYRNEEYGFEVRYPGDWEISTQTGGSQGEVRYVIFRSQNSEGPADLTVSYDGNNFNKSLDQYVKEGQDGYVISKLDAVKINFAGSLAWEIVSQGMISHYSILVVNSDHLYEIAFNTKENKQQLTQTDNQVLSTFRFTK